MSHDPDVDVFDLFEDGRFGEAAALLDGLLVEEPDDGTLLGLRALCARETADDESAFARARDAVRRDPDNPFAHWVYGAMLDDANRHDEAESAALRCLELDPEYVFGYRLLAQVHLGRQRWAEAASAATTGLAVHPDDEGCEALRLVALRYRDGSDAWAGSLESLLDRFPASSWVRAGQGWAALDRGAAVDAHAHFEQALTLDPTSEWARSGLIEATKARNPAYRLILRFFLRFERLPGNVRWGVIIGGLLLFRFIREATRAEPTVAPLTYPLMGAWALFVLLSWTVRPLSDFVLWLDRAGRPLVTGTRRRAALWVSGTVGFALFVGGLAAIARSEQAALVALGAAVLVIPMSAVFQCVPGWPRTAMAWFTALAALPLLLGSIPGLPGAGYFVGTSLLLSVLGSWVGNVLATRRFVGRRTGRTTR